MAAQLSSTGISHTVSSLTSLQSISPQSTAALPWDCSTIAKLPLPAAAPSRGLMAAASSDSHSFRLPQISCFTLSLKCFSSDSDNRPDLGIRPLVQLPHSPKAGLDLLTLLFYHLLPSSHRDLHCSLPLVRYCCSLSAGVLPIILFFFNIARIVVLRKSVKHL